MGLTEISCSGASCKQIFGTSGTKMETPPYFCKFSVLTNEATVGCGSGGELQRIMRQGKPVGATLLLRAHI